MTRTAASGIASMLARDARRNSMSPATPDADTAPARWLGKAQAVRSRGAWGDACRRLDTRLKKGAIMDIV